MPRRSSSFPAKSVVRRLLADARRITSEVGALVQRRARHTGVRARRKGVGDFVTEVDLAAERKLQSLLRAAHPGHGFLGEETGLVEGEEPFVWIVDPIDGTSNFSRGLRTHAVSVAACTLEGMPIAAAAYCEPESVLYSAAHGLGAFRGRQRLTPARRRLDDGSILGVQWFRDAAALPFLQPVVNSGARVRNLGCTVQQVCDVAAGRLDGNLQEQGRIWDLAAVALIAAEAGAKCTDWHGKPLLPFGTLSGDVHHPSLIAWPAVHAPLVRILRAAQSL